MPVGKRLRRVKAGDPICADEWNALADALERCAGLAGQQGGALSVRQTTSGHVLSLNRTRDIFVKLSGASSPYSWTEYLQTSVGTTTVMGRAGTSNAYEINGKAGLGGKYVWLTPTSAGDYRFQFTGVSSGASPTCQLCITVNGCFGQPLAGASVTVKLGGVTKGTGTTDASGKSCIDLSASGTGSYTVIVSATNFQTSTTTKSVTCPGTTNYTVTLTIDTTTYRCCCNIPVLRAKHLTDANGTHTFDLTSGLSYAPTTLAYTCISDPCDPCVAAPSNAAVTVTYNLTPSCDQLQMVWRSLDCSTQCGGQTDVYPLADGCAPPSCCQVAVTVHASTTCTGPPWTFTFPSTDPTAGHLPISGTVVVDV